MSYYSRLLACHQYALIDRVCLFPEPWHETLPLTPIVPKELKSNTDTMPALLALDPDAPWHQDLLKHLSVMERKGWKPIISCLLAVPEGVNPKLLVLHLQNRIIVHSPKRRAILRYYDSHIFSHFQRILHPNQLQALYGAVSQWTIRFENGAGIEWISEPAPFITENVPKYWFVSAEQRAALDRIGAVNQALDIWRIKTRPWENLAEYRDMAVRMDAIVAEEQRKRPDADEETIAFSAVKSLQKHQNMPLQPEYSLT